MVIVDFNPITISENLQSYLRDLGYEVEGTFKKFTVKKEGKEYNFSLDDIIPNPNDNEQMIQTFKIDTNGDTKYLYEKSEIMDNKIIKFYKQTHETIAYIWLDEEELEKQEKEQFIKDQEQLKLFDRL